MASAKRKPSAIDKYLADVKPDQRTVLERLRRAIHAVAPGVEECISYGIPAFRLNGALWFSSAHGRIIARFIQEVRKR